MCATALGKDSFYRMPMIFFFIGFFKKDALEDNDSIPYIAL